MRIKITYKRVLIVVFVYLICMCVSYGLLLAGSGPRVRQVGYDAVQTQKTITLTFDRPLAANQNVDAFVRLEPAVQFTASQAANRITLRLHQPLKSDAVYTVEVEPGLRDAQGRRIKRPLAKQIHTPPLSFTLLRRAGNCQERDCQDQVIERQVPSGHETVLAHGAHIKTYDRSRDYLVLVRAKDKQSDVLEVIDQRSHKTITVPLPAKRKISYVRLSSSLPVVTFISYDGKQRDATSEHVQSYLIAQRRLVDLKPPGNAAGIGEFFYSNDGRTLLLHTYNQAFYAVDPMRQEFKPVFIGVYVLTNGFNYDDSRILFQDASQQVLSYDVAKRATTSVALPSNAARFLYAADNNDIFFQYMSYEGGRVVNRLERFGAERQIVYEAGRQTVTEIALSPDGRYVALQLQPPANADVDDLAYYGDFVESRAARVLVYDLMDKRVASEATGTIPTGWR